MKKFIIGALVGLAVIAIGIGMSTGKIKIPQTNLNIIPQTATTTVEKISISNKKTEEQKGNVLYSFTLPVITHAPILQKNVDEYVLGFKESIERAAQEITFEGASNNYSLTIGSDVIRNDPKVVVIKMSAYEYTGGAHGNPSFAFFMYDVLAQRIISEDEIITNKKDPLLLSLIGDTITQKPEYNFESDGVRKSVFFDVNENKQMFIDSLSEGSFAITEKGILFKYSAYAIGPYVIGEPEVEIDFSQVEKFLSPFAVQFFK